MAHRSVMSARAAVSFAAAFLSACAGSTTPPTPAPTPTAASTRDPDAWIAETLARLSLRQKVGQMLVPRISGAYMPLEGPEFSRLREWIVTQGIGGVIITQGPPLEMAAKLNALQQLANVPLLVTADMEHGPGQILTSGYILPYGIDNGGATRFPPLMALGAARDERYAYELGRITALEGRAAGVHVTFSPVVDVNNNPNNPIINTRSYGENPEAVGRLAAAHIRGLQENGMIATAKHFPGHGDTGTDSHIELPVITVSKMRADSVELVPYREAVESGVGAIMSAHIAFPALTGDSIPGTLNPHILTGLLRNELGFRGIIFTDAMDMGAIIRNYGNTNAAVMAVKAGADALLQPLPQDVPAMIDAVVAAVERGELSEERINQSVHKLLQTKAQLGLHRQRTVDIARLPEVVGRESHVQIAQEAADRSITVVRDHNKLLPLRRVGRVLSIVYIDDYDPFSARIFQRTLGAAVPGLRMLMIDASADSLEAARMKAAADSADIVLFSPFIRVTASKGELAIAAPVASAVQALTASAKPLIVTSFGNPYILSQFPNVGTYVLAWGQWDVSQIAAARALLGEIPVTGKLPIAIPPFHQIGEGLTVGGN